MTAPIIVFSVLTAVSAALTKDYVPLMGVTLLMGLSIVMVNLITDLLYAVLDPRIRVAT